jgi:hypothetical protein
LLDDVGIISPDEDDAGSISVVATHLFGGSVLTDDAGGVFLEFHGSSVPR